MNTCLALNWGNQVSRNPGCSICSFWVQQRFSHQTLTKGDTDDHRERGKLASSQGVTRTYTVRATEGT